MDDVGLVTAVQRGDEEALADLFEECHGWAYSTCLNALRDTEAAEEATGRAFEIVIKTRLAGAAALRPAMIRLIYDACIEVERELLRRRWRRRRGEQPPAAPDPHDLRLVAWRAAGDLTGPDRILFALAAGEGFTGESIATAISPGKPASISARLESIREHVVADIVAARSLDDCPDLRDTLRYAAKEPDHAARRRINAHLAGGRKAAPCKKCTATRDRWPLAALAALLPLTAVPPGANDRLLDRMELALRAGLAAGTDRVRAVGAAKPSATAANVIDGSMATDAGVVPPVNPATPPSAETTQTDAEPAASGPAASGADAEASEWAAEPAAAAPPTGGAAPAETAAPAEGAAPAEAGGVGAPPTEAAGSGARRSRKVAAGMALVAAVIVLGAGVIALGATGGSGTSAQRLPAKPSGPPDLAPPVTTPRPTSSLPKQSPRPKASRSPATGQEISMQEASPSAPVSPSIRAVLRTVAPPKPADPFAPFGTLTVVSPDAGSTVGLDNPDDPDDRTANVTLSVAEPAGFDSALLDSALSWSGTYKLKDEDQYVDLGDGQSLNVDLPAAPRCTTPWTITATLTPPYGPQLQATTRVSIVAC
jgi:DNA-directed RNA polymerase specialized sigma24 family protein